MTDYKFDKPTNCWAVWTEYEIKTQLKVYCYLHLHCSIRMFWGTVFALGKHKLHFDINIATVDNR